MADDTKTEPLRYQPFVYARDLPNGWYGTCRLLGLHAFNGELCLTLAPEDGTYAPADYFVQKENREDMRRIALWALDHGQRVWVVLTGPFAGELVVQMAVPAPER